MYNDALVCCIKHNPNPVVIPITCTGVVPEIRFDQKQLDFKKVLLHRYADWEHFANLSMYFLLIQETDKYSDAHQPHTDPGGVEVGWAGAAGR